MCLICYDLDRQQVFTLQCSISLYIRSGSSFVTFIFFCLLTFTDSEIIEKNYKPSFQAMLGALSYLKKLRWHEKICFLET